MYVNLHTEVKYLFIIILLVSKQHEHLCKHWSLLYSRSRPNKTFVFWYLFFFNIFLHGICKKCFHSSGNNCIAAILILLLLQITAYIEAKQLKTAYFLAVKYKRISDIKKIMKEADVLNQPSIKLLCQKFLQCQQHPQKSKK